MNNRTRIQSRTCPICGASFDCGTRPGEKGCWCSRYPQIMPLETARGCQCPECLRKTIAARIQAFTETAQHEEILETAARYRHNPLVEGIDYRIEKGLYVFSAWYHYKRGHCCGNGCRHCPYSSRSD